jgi:glycosyltransferase involved in cell wall biosynthesis
MNKKLRIYLNSNAPWTPSGYSQQVAELAPLIKNEGYPLAIGDFFGLQGGKLMIDDTIHYPVINHVYGSDGLIHHANDFKADVTFTLQDIWVLNPQDLQQTRRFIPIVPIDHDPAPKPVLDNLRFAYRIVTYSKFGQKELERNGYHSTYIPHTVDTEVFTPMNVAQRKQDVGLPPNTYLVGMVAANKDNPPRKSFQEVIDAFNLFLQKVPNAMLYIHTNPDFPGGFNIKQYVDFLGLGNRVLFPDVYQMNFNTGKSQMALIYNTFDMLLMPSISEGFGVPAIEAQACGVPVVVNNFTSMPELIKPGETGEICELAYKRFSPQGSYMGIPSVQSIYDSMMKIYRGDTGKMKKAAREWAVSEYDSKKVFKTGWKPFLEKLEQEVYPTIDSTIAPTI